MAATTDLTDHPDTLAGLRPWPGPIERSINREIDYEETIAALRDAHDALARRGS